MSLDDARKKLEELKRLEEERKKKKKELKERQKNRITVEEGERPVRTSRAALRQEPSQSSIQGSIGSLNVILTQEIVNQLLQKIWIMDDLENSAIDDQILKMIKEHPSEFKLPFESQKLIQQAREKTFFMVDSSKKLPYREFRQSWQQYCGPGLPIDFDPQRREFTQLLTNKYKQHWVDEKGIPLSEGMFQMLYRMEREPKAIERLFELIQNSYMELMSETELRTYFKHLRKNIAKIFKDQFFHMLSSSSSQASPLVAKTKTSRIQQEIDEDESEEFDDEIL